MTTLAHPCHRTKPAPTVHGSYGTCRLVLSINDTRYAVRPIRPGFAGRKAFRLRKPDGMSYTIVRTLGTPSPAIAATTHGGETA